MAEEGVQFRFVEFVPLRAFRGAEAARVEVVQAGEQHLLWMSIADVRANMEEFGRHPELVKALEAYGIKETDESGQLVDCPALHQRSKSYPFGDRVPRRVRMLKTVTGDPMPVLAACRA